MNTNQSAKPLWLVFSLSNSWIIVSSFVTLPSSQNQPLSAFVKGCQYILLARLIHIACSFTTISSPLPRDRCIRILLPGGFADSTGKMIFRRSITCIPSGTSSQPSCCRTIPASRWQRNFWAMQTPAFWNAPIAIRSWRANNGLRLCWQSGFSQRRTKHGNVSRNK